MNNKRFGFRRLPMLLAAMIILCSFFTSCEYFVAVHFGLESISNDTITFMGWSDAYQDGVIHYTSPYVTNAGERVDNVTFCTFRAGGGPNVSVSEEQAFIQLMSDFDSVKITRSSDGASTITYRHDDNATDAQRYFFTREAWKCNPEGEELKSRTYTFILKDEMFE